MSDPILRTSPLGFPWATSDPFLFCVHHLDAYPPGNERLGPATSLRGRDLGNDFEVRDGFRMYHGQTVPGFPGHPHRGFETVTVVQRGFIDHADSLGAAARFGDGDTQWLTAGRGVVHSEMFPLLRTERPNTTELFQIWLNLPKRSKIVAPHFSMLWRDRIPHEVQRDTRGRETTVDIVAGSLHGVPATPPPPESWAANASNEVAIWTIKMDRGATCTLPAASPGVNRSLYFFAGHTLRVADREVRSGTRIELSAEHEVRLINGDAPGELLFLQGRPIGEPVAQQGPFVMSTRAELEQAFQDYERTRFGGWPWPSEAPVHARSEGRFARYPDGRIERPGSPEL